MVSKLETEWKSIMAHAQRWEWYQKVPAWSVAVNSYSNEFPGDIGHCVTPLVPSAQAVPFWNIPCQCYNVSSGCYIKTDWHAYNTSGSQHGSVWEVINDIHLKGCALQRLSHRARLAATQIKPWSLRPTGQERWHYLLSLLPKQP